MSMNFSTNIKYRNPLVKKVYKPQNCPKGNVLYRITFKYKTNFSGNKFFNLTSKNFPDFEIDIPNRPLAPGDYVRYTPVNRNDPNYGKIAMISIETNKQYYGKIVKMYDLVFIAPQERNNKVIREIKTIPEIERQKKVLTLVPQLRIYQCAPPFIAMSYIKEFEESYKLYNQMQTNKRLRRLREKGERLFDNYFVLGKNNEPLYPEFIKRGQNGFEFQQHWKNKLNKQIKKLVDSAFLSGTKSQKPRVKGSGKSKSLEFVVPKGAKGGDKITVSVDGISVNVSVPFDAKPLFRVTVPIKKSDNEAVYDSLQPKKSKIENYLTFQPTFITAKYSNDKHLDIHKLVKASNDQTFKIVDASIVKQESNANFKFKQLARFDKKSYPLIFDLEVYINLRLQVSREEKEDASTNKRVLGKIGDFIQNSGNDCPDKMDKLKNSISMLNEQLKKPRTKIEKSKITKKIRKEERKKASEKKTQKNKTIIRNRTKKRMRKYGGSKRLKKYKKKRKTKNIKKKRIRKTIKKRKNN